MHKFYIVCRCIKEQKVYEIELGKTYTGEGQLNSDGTVDYLIHKSKSPYGPQLYKGEFFGHYFEIISAS